MNCRGKFCRTLSGQREAQAGYMLLTLMLLAALVVIALAAVAPKLSQQIRRDQEEELIHRGVQYSRAIRKFYKKFGHYPVRLEELDNSNNIRFLRKHYQDPITGKDFKLLHFPGEVQMSFSPGIAGAAPPGLASATPGAQSGGNVQPGPSFGPSPSRGQDTSNPTPDQNQSSSSSSLSSTANSSASPVTAGSNSPPGASVAPTSQGAGSPLTFGGSAIVGVVSTSKKQSIREFNKKDHYDQWQFIYDPGTDRGGLLNTPAQPALQGVGQTQVTAPPGQSANPPGVPTLGGPAGSSPQPPPQMPPNQPPQ